MQSTKELAIRPCIKATNKKTHADLPADVGCIGAEVGMNEERSDAMLG